MSTATKEQSTQLERQQRQLEDLTNEANVLEVENARLRDKERMVLEERARTSPSTLSKLFQIGGEASEIQKKIQKNEKRLENIRLQAGALGVAITESRAQRTEERTEAFRERQKEIHGRELQALDRVFESFNELARLFHESYAPCVTEAHQLLGEARHEGLVSPTTEKEWGRIAKPAVTPPKNFEHFLADCLGAAFRGGNAMVGHIYREKVDRRGGGGVPNPYAPRKESS